MNALYCLQELEDILQKKINYLVKHPDDADSKKLPGLVESLKDLHDIKKESLTESEEPKLRTYLFIFYNPSACETQTHKVKAKNKHVARHLFWQKYPRKRIEIELIEEV